MTIAAFHRIDAIAVFTTLHAVRVPMTVVTLQWNVAGWMAVQAARAHEDLVSCKEGSLCGGFVALN
jgi:hypothetical protein